MKKKIAVTGGIGSGKSSVLACLKNMGYPIFSCDDIYREVIDSPQYIEEITKFFPACVEHGKINRKKLADAVFNDKEKLSILNGIAHPLIIDRLLTNMEQCSEEVIFAEVPLLFEGNYENLFDRVIVVVRNKETRIQAIMHRDSISVGEANARIAAQFDYDNPKNQERLKNQNVIFIQNNGDFSHLENQVKNLNF